MDVRNAAIAGLVTSWTIGAASAAVVTRDVEFSTQPDTPAMSHTYCLYTSNTSVSGALQEYSRDIVPVTLDTPFTLTFESRNPDFVGAAVLIGLDGSNNVMWAANGPVTWTNVAKDWTASGLGDIINHLYADNTAALKNDFNTIGSFGGSSVAPASFVFEADAEPFDLVVNLNRATPSSGQVITQVAGTVNLDVTVPEPTALCVAGCAAGIFLLRRGQAQRVA